MKITLSQTQISFIALRIVVSIIILSHGLHRLFTNGIEPFGVWLNSQGLPLGFFIAWSITLLEIIGAPFIALGKKLPHFCFAYIILYFSGLLMVHLEHGWFVVGSGSNGIEYSLLLITALFSIGYPHINELFKNKP
jgi:putative oxidoreductase